MKNSRLNRASSVSKYAYKINGRSDLTDAVARIGVEEEILVMAGIVDVIVASSDCNPGLEITQSARMGEEYLAAGTSASDNVPISC